MPLENNSCSGLLSSQEIHDYGLIEQIKKDCLHTSSYDLRVGDKHYLYEASGDWKAIFLGSSDALVQENANITPGSRQLLTQPHRGGDKLVIPPFGSAIVQLEETVNLYRVANEHALLITGRFDLKLKAIYKGLISQQATQVEPCYRGKLYCFLHNLGSQEVILNKGEKLATIEFSYAGQTLDETDRKKIIAKTIRDNQKKYVNSRFVYKTGIKDIRWLYDCGMLPKAAGIAPIYCAVNENVADAVNKHLETSDAVEHLAERIEGKIGEKQNTMRIVLALIGAVIAFFTANFLIDINAELRYFQEELSFLANSTIMDPASLEAIQSHTQELAEQRNFLMWATIGFIIALVVLIRILFAFFLRPRYEQKWEHKRKTLKSKKDYIDYKEEYEQARKNKPKAKNRSE